MDLHGGNIYRNKNYLDFSANINPMGLPDGVKRAVIESCILWDKYPDPDCTELVRKLSARESISSEQVVCGNGADELIQRIITTVRPSKAFVCCPSFEEYSRLLTANGCEVKCYFLEEYNGFFVKDDIINHISNDVDMVFICNPNNPVGNTVSPDILELTAIRCLEYDKILVCDESFIEFVTDWKRKSIRSYINKNVVILKAFTKIYAMAGLRLGYGIFGSEELAQKVRSASQYWSISVPAQAAGAAALDETEYIRSSLEYINKERDFLVAELSGMGFRVYQPEANFIFFRSDIPVAKALESYGIMIRNCGNYRGLDGRYFRIAVRRHEENLKLISALKEIVNG